MYWYYVEQASDAKHWQVLCEEHPDPQCYEEREAAVEAAGSAARQRHASQGESSGVRIRCADGWRDDEVFAPGRGRRRE